MSYSPYISERNIDVPLLKEVERCPKPAREGGKRQKEWTQ